MAQGEETAATSKKSRGSLTDGECDDVQLIADEFDDGALLNGRGATAEDAAAATRQVDELLLHVLLEREFQGFAVNDKD